MSRNCGCPILPVAQSTFRRGATVQSIRVRLTAPEAFDAFASRIEGDPALGS